MLEVKERIPMSLPWRNGVAGYLTPRKGEKLVSKTK